MQKFTPDMITEDMKIAAHTVFVTMAYTETIRPIVEGYQKKVLDFWEFEVDPKWHDKRDFDPDKAIIRDPTRAYLMSDKDIKLYFADCNDEQEKAGLHTESPDHCPLLVAEHQQVLAERVLMNCMTPITGLEAGEFYGENRAKMLDLTLKLLAPFVKGGS